MRKLTLIVLLLTFALAVSGCVTTGTHASPPPSCPVLQEVPAPLMQTPNFEQRTKDRFLKTSPDKSGTAQRLTLPSEHSRLS